MEDYIKKNLAAFQKLSEDKNFSAENNLKYALFHEGKFIEAYNNLDDAYKIAEKLYPDNDFFIRQVNAPEHSYGLFNDLIVSV